MGDEKIDSAALAWSQQDFDHDWLQESWPLEADGVIDCLNPSCNSDGFARARLIEIVSEALESGELVAGAMRCEGLDRASVAPCTNALVYMLEFEQP